MHFIYVLLLFLLLGPGDLFAAAAVPASPEERVGALKEKFPSALANLIEGYAEELNLDEDFYKKLHERIERLDEKHPDSRDTVIPSVWRGRMTSPTHLLSIFKYEVESALEGLRQPGYDLVFPPDSSESVGALPVWVSSSDNPIRNPEKVRAMLEDLDSIEDFFRNPKQYGKPKGVQTAEMKKARQAFELAQEASKALNKEIINLVRKYQDDDRYERDTDKINQLPGKFYSTKISNLQTLVRLDAFAIVPDAVEKIEALAHMIREHNKEYKALMQEWEKALLAEPQE